MKSPWPDRHWRTWTGSDKALLRRLHARGLDNPTMAGFLERTPLAVKKKRQRMGGLQVRAVRAKRAVTRDEVERIRALRRKHVPYRTIGKMLDRDYMVVFRVFKRACAQRS